MAGHEPITTFDQWYDNYSIDDRDGCLSNHARPNKHAGAIYRRFEKYKREVDVRLANYEKLEKLADAEVVSPKPDLPNISSGDTAGLIRRIARNLVQNTPNVEVISKFDDDDPMGLFAKFILTSKIIGSDQYSNDMQQSLFASTKTGLTLGFDCVVPVLLQDAANGWYMKYDSIHYRDVFPEPGAKDVRNATEVFVRRYLTPGEIIGLIRDQAVGWDLAALHTLLKSSPSSRHMESVDHQTKKRHVIPDGYEVITLYSSSGAPFLTFSPTTQMLLRIEKNKHPLRHHPVHFLVLEKDDQQPFGKSQVELLLGRQDLQDLLLNGAMKLWYRNINPSIIGYGTINAVPNLSPGKYTQISNPQARLEPFEVNTQTLLQYGTITQQNLGSMVNLVGAADQQMAQNAGGGMSATPQGVEAQQAMVDITTNNYQKAIEGFFSHYCSYALTMYFQELRAVKSVQLTADARIKLTRAGFPVATEDGPEIKGPHIKSDGSVDVDFEELATEYWVRCVPGSLTELEDEKQLRILNQLFVPLSQALPALAAAGNPEMIMQAAQAMSYIVSKQIELSGATSAQELKGIFAGQGDAVTARDERLNQLEQSINGITSGADNELAVLHDAVAQLKANVTTLTENNQLLLEKLGVFGEPSAPESNSSPAQTVPVV